MAIIRVTNNAKMRGQVGATTYYVRNGEQIARQAQNNSNYGEEASRTEAQMVRRVKWANLVNVYKACRFWMLKAFENKSQNQTDYNRFMSVNADNARVNLTKQEANQGNAVLDAYLMSQGSIPAITLGFESGDSVVTTDITLGEDFTTLSTVGAFSEAVIANNPAWRDGDNLAIITFIQISSPYGVHLSSTYDEITLDVTSDAPIVTTTAPWVFASLQGVSKVLTFKVPEMIATWRKGLVLIHTRKEDKLLTSTQRAVVFDSSILDEYTTETKEKEAMLSYGIDTTVPLDPGEGVTQ